MDLDKLFYLQGIGNGFEDCDGIYHDIPQQDREHLLHIMCKQDAQDSVDTWGANRIDELDASPWRKLLRSFQWTHQSNPQLVFQVPADFSGQLTLQFSAEGTYKPMNIVFGVQDAEISGDYFTQNVSYVERRVSLQALFSKIDTSCPDVGYHQIQLSFSDVPGSAVSGMLVIAPERVYGANLSDIVTDRRPWGVSLQVFSLWQATEHHKIPTAIGDFANLENVITVLANKGADFLLLNPLHALPLHAPEDASPYSPYDRRRINPLYIAPSLSAEGKAKSWKGYLPKRMVATDKGTDWIDYSAAAKLKAAELKAMFKVFCDYKETHARHRAYRTFLRQEGDALSQYAEQQAEQAAAPWLKNADFYRYLQFVAEEQLAACQQLAMESGMKIGLIRDMAVGAVGGGVEVMQDPEQFCTRASIGAPPDPFAPQGQNWGLTPLDPIGLKQHNFRHYIELLRSNMRHCGALRIDHFMGLFRLWWWPVAASNEEQPGGSYIYYPFDAMMALLRLESHRAKCMVIGEDLGLVPPEIKQPMFSAGIYSNELFYFCSDEYNFPQYAGFKHPNDYKHHSLMMLANHDVPTMAAWWHGKDLLMREQLHLLEDGELAQLQQRRELHKQGVLHWLAEIAGSDVNNTQFTHLLPDWAKAVGSGRSQLYSVALADLLAEEDAINIPGTSSEYPNWRRRYSQSVSQLSQDELLDRVLTAIRSARSTQN